MGSITSVSFILICCVCRAADSPEDMRQLAVVKEGSRERG